MIYKLRKLIRKLGVVKTTIVFTCIIMLASFLTASFIIVLILGWQLNLMLALLSITIPMVIVPLTMPLIFTLIISLDKTEEELQVLSKMDSLTRIYNRYFIIQSLEHEMEKINRYGGNLSIAIFDVDDFKHINDTYGHVCGDAVLKRLSEKVREVTRSADLVGRYGGEEFLVIMPMTSEAESLNLSHRIKNEIASENFKYSEEIIKLTISIGVAQYVQGERIEEFINRADHIMYNFKHATKKNTSHSTRKSSKKSSSQSKQ